MPSDWRMESSSGSRLHFFTLSRKLGIRSTYSLTGRIAPEDTNATSAGWYVFGIRKGASPAPMRTLRFFS